MSRRFSIGITCYPTYGGSGIVATEIGLAMARRGHRVHFVCSGLPIRLPMCANNVWFHEVRAAEYPLFQQGPYALALASRMVEVARYERLDLLHVHYALPHAASAYLAKQILGDEAPRIVTTLHGTDITLVGSDPSYLPITRFSIEQSDAITAPSQFLVEETARALGVEAPIDLIPNFVDTQRWVPVADAARERAGLASCFHDPAAVLASSDPILFHVSNFRAVKRVLDVIAIFAEVCKRRPVRLVMLGDGPDRARAEARVRELQLWDRVAFLGKQGRFETLLANSDVFLLPSGSESFGLAALEALSCGVPVVASDVGGVSEVVTHGETGFLAPMGHVEAMAGHVLTLLGAPDTHAAMAAAARRSAVERYAMEQAIDRYEALIERLLG